MRNLLKNPFDAYFQDILVRSLKVMVYEDFDKMANYLVASIRFMPLAALAGSSGAVYRKLVVRLRMDPDISEGDHFIYLIDQLFLRVNKSKINIELFRTNHAGSDELTNPIELSAAGITI